MTEYSEQELQANLADILDNLKAGQTVRITRNGKTCGMLTGVYHGKKEPLSSLEGALRGQLPDATYEDFLGIKTLWEPPNKLPTNEFPQ